MAEEYDVIFIEGQKFPLWLRLLIVLSMVLVLALAVFPFQEIVSKQDSTRATPLILLIVTMIIVPIAIAVLFVMAKLETKVRPDGLYVRFFPFHIRFRKFAPDDLSEFYARTYKPIREYGGWGIRRGLGKTGKAYNLSGNKGVQLVFKNGKRLLIGSQRADELADAVKSILKG